MISTADLCRQFRVGDSVVHALDHVDLQIDGGDFVAVMGPSGSGKSTLMNILGCLDTPDDGQYWLLEQPVAELDDDALSRVRNLKIGFVFQSFHLLPRMTALENVLLPLRYSDIDVGAARARGEDLLRRLGLEDRMDHRPNQLSGGQRQRVAIARSLINEPPLLLADEPTGNLDSRTSDEIMDLFGEINQQGQTILMVTHEEEIASHAKRLIRMRDGRIEHDSSHS
ncbi:MAG: ABC transporter ATP-binding protein [Xanthomonadales bacterium]|nr:ABC transporter ATP-binding protein [Gammaproteobacteria bacterium]MBT8053413.1 ABC transporter ATP-binding protein [Gammaproteobacteria bacterium]NND57440.1 ABC transporter ATP-binding protein [Xanthomonadales bacterium]NNK52098.1 ABC transporter ATP-binding protein [Xanthomonadales bacterium]